MEIRVVTGDIAQISVDAIVVNLFEGVQQPGGATGAVDQALDGAITQLIAEGEIKGKLGEMTLIHTFGKIPPKRVVVAGLGKSDSFTIDKVRNLSADVGRFLRRVGTERAATIVHGAGIGGLDPAAAAQALMEGAILGLYSFRRHMTQPSEQKDVKELIIVERDGGKVPVVAEGVDRGRILAEATNLARDMANDPANSMTPSRMAEIAKKVAEEYSLEYKVLEREDMEALGMGAILGVAQGSVQPPKLIAISYRGDDHSGSRATLGLLGKGVTFDSGGISLKPAEGMGEMKTDMSGGAAVIAAMQAIAQLKPRVNVMGVIPAAENLPGGNAYRPGDVLKAMSGKTIEVISTDAEGRLLLADAIAYALREGCTHLVDVATLTGACSVALGPYYSGVFTNNQELADQLLSAAKRAGELMWQMPMDDDYKELIKGDVSDIKNSASGRQGGAITAAQFLAEFSGDTPWVHLDVAPTARAEKDKGYITKGATGVTVRTLVNLALSFAQD